ncbi:hypothetical protein M0R45_019195 [Rubus argutus]|uniref:Uncharacterized protein n=1 Tax=Rubus argutus TaxID=59490 RepID=A0AAW1X6N9_RUBAR
MKLPNQKAQQITTAPLSAAPQSINPFQPVFIQFRHHSITMATPIPTTHYEPANFTRNTDQSKFSREHYVLKSRPPRSTSSFNNHHHQPPCPSLINPSPSALNPYSDRTPHHDINNLPAIKQPLPCHRLRTKL